jgi:hypothetical protein
MAKEKKPVLVDVREIGAKGGRNSRKNLDPKLRTELARRAADARWEKKKKVAGEQAGVKKAKAAGDQPGGTKAKAGK